ncbi:MAG: SAM-dependent methyltransferase [Chloroflexi bacterium]|nr:SAM-dependent methyltransferase [Chloroflexota bacterium]
MGDAAEAEVRKLIQRQGKITFAQFMETALFSPRGGYYTSGTARPGRDYYTAPATHPIFGALIALQLEQLWQVMDYPSPFHVVEVGAGTGALGLDILAYTSQLSSGFGQALEYVAVDYNPQQHGSGRLHATRAFGLPFRDLVGCILSNELLDSFPVHRFAIEGDRIREVYVTLGETLELVETLDEPSTARIQERLSGLELDLPEGFRGEVNLALEGWAAEVSRSLKRGVVLTFDYGHLATDLYSYQRSQGTLRCYYEHTLGSNPYLWPGQQDITAHVDFTSLASWGEEHGLTTAGFTSQREFLYNLGFPWLLASLNERPLSQRERDANRMAMLELVKPGEMGDFKVLAQSRRLPSGTPLHGFSLGSPLRQDLQNRKALLDIPLLSKDHMGLMAARYPHLTWDWEALWPPEREP